MWITDLAVHIAHTNAATDGEQLNSAVPVSGIWRWKFGFSVTSTVLVLDWYYVSHSRSVLSKDDGEAG